MKRISSILIALSVLIFSAHANPAKLFQQGNKALAAGKFEAAIDAYVAAEAVQPESPEIQYNLGNAQYRSGLFEEAAGTFEYAASLAQTPRMRSLCWYNMGNCLVKISNKLSGDDPQTALNYSQQAVSFYREALYEAPQFFNAAYNLEMTQRIAADLAQKVQDKQDQQQQENSLLQYIRKKLEEFIRRQSQLIETQTTGEPQKLLEQETRALVKVMQDSGLCKPITLPDEPPILGPLKTTHDHTLNAANAMAKPDQPTALKELQAALESAPADPQQKNGDSEEDSDEMGDEESDQDADTYQEGDPFGDFSEYEETRGVPPPNQSEMDILAEEIRNQERRKSKKAGKYKAVEKDW